MVGPTKIYYSDKPWLLVYWRKWGRNRAFSFSRGFQFCPIPCSMLLAEPCQLHPRKKNSFAKKAAPTHTRKFSKYIKKTFIKGRTSFGSSNSDLLEESFVKIQIPGFAWNRSVLPPSFSNSFFQSSSKISGSISNFVRSTSCLTKVENREDENLEVESVISMSSAEIEIAEERSFKQI